MHNLPRYLAAALSLGAGLCVFAASVFKGAALPLWIVGLALIVAALLLVARAQSPNPATRNAWMLGALGLVAVGGIIGALAGAHLR